MPQPEQRATDWASVSRVVGAGGLDPVKPTSRQLSARRRARVRPRASRRARAARSQHFEL